MLLDFDCAARVAYRSDYLVHSIVGLSATPGTCD
jgi:hypothetical protein